MTNPPATESSERSGPPARSPFPPIRTVTLGAPFDWLALGWRDLRGAPAASLFYGAAFALMGLLIHLVFQHMVELTSALTAGFLLLGPFLATGLYDISRRRQRGEPVALREHADGVARQPRRLHPVHALPLRDHARLGARLAGDVRAVLLERHAHAEELLRPGGQRRSRRLPHHLLRGGRRVRIDRVRRQRRVGSDDARPRNRHDRRRADQRARAVRQPGTARCCGPP